MNTDEELVRLGYDLAISPRVSAARLMEQRLLDDHFVTVARRDHPVVKKKLTLSQFVALDHIQIAVGATPGGPVEDALGAPMIVAKSDLILTLANRIARALAPLLDLQIFPTPIPVKPFSIHQMWHEQKQADPAHVWFRSLIASVAKAI
ncbi:hypothetical protein BH09MYX1_BH09MYX1_25450 [soil metagenome]